MKIMHYEPDFFFFSTLFHSRFSKQLIKKCYYEEDICYDHTQCTIFQSLHLITGLHMHRKKQLEHLLTVQNDLSITSVRVFFFSLKSFIVFFFSEVSHLLNKTNVMTLNLNDCSCFFILLLLFIHNSVSETAYILSLLSAHFLILRYIDHFSIQF